ncbi:MAG: 16S rRNA processing protein RimM [Bacteroidales bacterium]|nr:16S rRNA processing protein RimM [Bacteroidales bacterium]
MNKDDCYLLGRIIKTSGYHGDLVFFFDVDDVAPYEGIETVFIDIGGGLVPFMIEHLQFRPNRTATVHLEDVDDQETAVALLRASLYLPLDWLPPLSGKKFYFHEIKGFIVIDQQLGTLGPVISVIDVTAQPLLEISYRGKKILIPAVDEIIRKIDRKAKTIQVLIPEGLLEINA